MAKWLIVYSSVTGNTKKVAAAMADALDDVKIVPVEEAPTDFSKFTALILGYWVWRGGPDPKMLDYLPLVENKPVMLFSTHSTERGSEHAVTSIARGAAALGRGCTVLATFECPGQVSEAIAAKRRQAQSVDEPHAKATGWRTSFGHPDSADLEIAISHLKKAESKLNYYLKKHGKE